MTVFNTMEPSEACEYLLAQHGIRRKVATLAKLRCVGGGPIFRRAGRAIVYDRANLDIWATGLLGRPMTSTSDVGIAAAA